MNIYVKRLRDSACVCDALILPVTEGGSKLYDKHLPHASRVVRKLFSKEFQGKENEVLLFHSPDDITPERILLVGLGRKNELSKEKLRRAGGKALAYLRDMKMKKIALSTHIISSLRLSPVDFIEGALLGLYTFNKYRKEADNRNIDSLTILSNPSKKLSDALKWIETEASAVNFTRDLVNTPSNDMTPVHLAQTALSMKRKNLSVKVLNESDAKRLGMGAYLSVAKGSSQPPKFIVLEYRTNERPPLVLIGKSITFDSGGISLKPAEGMEKMKYDMAGGAVVLGVIKAVSELKLKTNLVGILPAAENLPGGSASKPGDVIKAINGKTVEIINTDAEGRMAVADAIGYAKRFKPRAIIDIATLTGACSIALGSEAIAMMGNDRQMINYVRKSASDKYEQVWEMPLFEEYKEYLKSDIADIKNTGGKNGSLVTSAYFLYEFAGKVPWVHMDIAGTAWIEKEKPYMPKGASGIGVRLLLNLIKELK